MSAIEHAKLFAAQVWTIPAFPSELSFPSGSGRSCRILPVTTNLGPNGSPFLLSLTELEFDGPVANSTSAFGRIGAVFDWIAFVSHARFEVFCARILPVELSNNVPAESIDYPGAPPGLSVYESRVGFATSGAFFAPPDIDAAMAPNVRRGIQWYLHGRRSSIAAEQVASFWIGLEALAPDIRAPLRCPKCEKAIPKCPECRESTESPRVIASIKRLLVEEHQLCTATEVTNCMGSVAA